MKKIKRSPSTSSLSKIGASALAPIFERDEVDGERLIFFMGYLLHDPLFLAVEDSLEAIFTSRDQGADRVLT